MKRSIFAFIAWVLLPCETAARKVARRIERWQRAAHRRAFDA